MSCEKELNEMREILDNIQNASIRVGLALERIATRPRWPKIAKNLELIHIELAGIYREVELAGRRERKELDKSARTFANAVALLTEVDDG